MLGKLDAASNFTVQTKVLSGSPGALTADNIATSIKGSMEALKTNHVPNFFFHLPDPSTSLEESLKAMDNAHQDGKFDHLGISNYPPAEVQRMIEICEVNGYIKPSIYQGHYNVISRGPEEELFPLLRKHNIAFQAYR
jgi:aflatoxin B1 aldehyde reductase